MIQEEIKAHEELDEKFNDCNCCCPVLEGEKYCDKCKKLITDFLDKWGEGVLTRDEMFEELQDKIKDLEKDNEKLTRRLTEKIRQLELRKEEKPEHVY